jgi:hypothetical protein
VVHAASADAATNAKALGVAAGEYMLTAYSCQNYIGGLELYRTIKLTTENMSVKLGVDRNKAVLMVQESEDLIKSKQPHIALEKMRKEKNIAQEDVATSCRQMLDEAQDKVKLLQAKLNLL